MEDTESRIVHHGTIVVRPPNETLYAPSNTPEIETHLKYGSIRLAKPFYPAGTKSPRRRCVKSNANDAGTFSAASFGAPEVVSSGRLQNRYADAHLSLKSGFSMNNT